MPLQELGIAIYLKVYEDDGSQKADNQLIQLWGFCRGWKSLELDIGYVGRQGRMSHETEFSYNIVKKHLRRTGADNSSIGGCGGFGLAFIIAEGHDHTFPEAESARCELASGWQA